jgi:hypothetical protein
MILISSTMAAKIGITPQPPKGGEKKSRCCFSLLGFRSIPGLLLKSKIVEEDERAWVPYKWSLEIGELYLLPL